MNKGNSPIYVPSALYIL